MTSPDGHAAVFAVGVTMPRFSLALSRIVTVACVLVMVGWILDVQTLTSIYPGYSSMKFNTALCLLALALSLESGSWRVALPLAGGAFLVTALTLIEICSGRDLGIDQLLIDDHVTRSGTTPGRMATATAVALICLAVARVGMLAGLRRRVEPVLAISGIISVLALLGYVFDVEQFYRVASLSSVSLHSALSLLLLSVAMGARIPGGVLPWAARGSGPGAAVVRHSLPLLVVGLVVAGLVTKALGDAGAFGVHFGTALMVMGGGLIAVGATAIAARRLDWSHLARIGAEQSLQQLNSTLVEGRDAAWARADALAVELDRERSRFESALGNTDDVVWTVETTGGATQHVYVSPNTARLLGTAADDAGRPFPDRLADLVDPASAAACAEFNRLVADGHPAEAEVLLTVAGEGARWIWLRGSPRTDDERLFFDGVATDVTDRRLLGEQRERMLEQEQLQVKRLSELTRVREDFTTVAGHELRTPVTVILGYAEMLIDPEVTAMARDEAIEVIHRRALQLSELVERVFDLAKMDSNTMELIIEDVELTPFLDDLVADYLPTANSAGIALTTDGVGAVVKADRGRLRQVFDNLLSNAIKYTPAGGRVDLDVSAAGEVVTWRVSDTGIGVAPDELPRLFDRMFRAESARDARIPGTGLGLAVTKGLVEAHGGTIRAQHNAPHGIVVTVDLPNGRGG